MQNPCPDGKHLGGRDCNNCKGECVSETTQDGTTREACCVDEGRIHIQQTLDISNTDISIYLLISKNII